MYANVKREIMLLAIQIWDKKFEKKKIFNQKEAMRKYEPFS